MTDRQRIEDPNSSQDAESIAVNENPSTSETSESPRTDQQPQSTSPEGYTSPATKVKMELKRRAKKLKRDIEGITASLLVASLLGD